MQKQRPHVRQPSQKRSQEKVELILEAAMRLLDKGGMALLTTNAVAATAGVSVGTIYQYFSSKEAILDELARRESSALSGRVLAVMDDPSPGTPEQRVVSVVRAVLASFGERRSVHRVILEQSLANGIKRVGALTEQIMTRLLSEDRQELNRPVVSAVQAYVITHSIVGVLRAIVSGDDDTPPLAEVEVALAKLISSVADDLRPAV